MDIWAFLSISSAPKRESQKIRKMLVSIKFLSAILGPEMAAPIFMDTWKNAFFLQEKPMSIKFLLLGGGECRFYFYGRRDFSEKSFAHHAR